MDVIYQSSEYSDYRKVRLQLLRSEKSTENNWCVESNSLIMSFIFLSHINRGTMGVSMHILLSFLCSLLNIAFFMHSKYMLLSFLPSFRRENISLPNSDHSISSFVFRSCVCV